MLSDDEIKTDWTLRHDDRLWDSHLEANARIRELEAKLQESAGSPDFWAMRAAKAEEANEQYKSQISRLNKEVRVAKNDLVLAEQLIGWIDAAVDGEGVCDFAESFPMVRQVADLWHDKRCLEMQLENCRLEAEGVTAYIHDAKVAEDRADRAEAKLRELYGYLLQADKDGESTIPQELGAEIEELLTFKFETAKSSRDIVLPHTIKIF